MNLILFEAPFEQLNLSADDPRTRHILSVLKIKLGGVFYVGFINGQRALAKIETIDEDSSIVISIIERMPSPPCLPVDLLIGMPRPHTAKRVLFEGACLGVRQMHFFQSEHTEPSYMKSRLWSDENYKERLLLGAEQSFTTHIPEVFVHTNLNEALSHINSSENQVVHLALDNYEAKQGLGLSFKNRISSNIQKHEVPHIYLAFGSERGWSDSERALLIKKKWEFAHLGNRVLRLEMAVVSAIAITADRVNFWEGGTASSL